jgi:ribosome recycling factor
MNPDVLESLKQKLGKVMEVIQNDMGTIRTGRANPSLVENIVISAYGGTAKLRVMELATIGVSDAATIVITPFDKATVNEIVKGIQEENIGLNPSTDGQVIRISLPPLSQERREEVIKLMKHKLLNGQVLVRQARHEGMDDVKKLAEEDGLSEDEKGRLEKEVQKLIDEAMSRIDSIGKQKEAELLQI